MLKESNKAVRAKQMKILLALSVEKTMKFLRSDTIERLSKEEFKSELSAVARGALTGLLNNWSDAKVLPMDPFLEDASALLMNARNAITADMSRM